MAKLTTPIFKPDGKNAIHDGIEHEPGGGKASARSHRHGFSVARSPVRLVPNRQGHQRDGVAREHHGARQSRRDAPDSRDHHGFGAGRTERTADAGDSGERASRDLCAAQRRGQCLGQRGVREGGARNGQEDFGHGRRVDERLRHVPRARCEGRRLQGLRRDGCFGRPERNGFENDARALHPSRRDPDERQRRALRGAPHLEPSRRRWSSPRSTPWSRRTIEPSWKAIAKRKKSRRAGTERRSL